MAGVFILGMVAITLLMGMMKSVLGLPADRVLGFTLFPFLVLLLLEGVFLRLLLHGRRRVEGKQDALRPKEQVTNELDAAHARALPEPRSSVTEHTTRSFAPIHDERNSK
jgi:hypothetical protein